MDCGHQRPAAARYRHGRLVCVALTDVAWTGQWTDGRTTSVDTSITLNEKGYLSFDGTHRRTIGRGDDYFYAVCATGRASN